MPSLARDHKPINLISWREPLLGGEAGGASADDVWRDQDQQFGIGLLLVFIRKHLIERRHLGETERAEQGALVGSREVPDDDGGLAFPQIHRASELAVRHDGDAVKGLSSEGADLNVKVQRHATAWTN